MSFLNHLETHEGGSMPVCFTVAQKWDISKRQRRGKACAGQILVRSCGVQPSPKIKLGFRLESMLEGLEEEGVVSRMIELAILMIVFPVVEWKWQVRMSFILRQDGGGRRAH